MDNAPLKVGQPAPEFELMNQDRKAIKLSDFRGTKKVVLIFYPMDFSPTCTAEHCSFGPNLGKIQADEETVVFGVSCDSPFCHAAYKKQFNIPYDLLSDMTRKMCKAYGLFAGAEPYNCTKRGTVVVGKDGNVAFYEEVAMREARSVEHMASVAHG